MLAFGFENFSGAGALAVGADDATFGDFAAVGACLLADALAAGRLTVFGGLAATTSLVFALIAAVAAGGRTAFRAAALATTRSAGLGAAARGVAAEGRRAFADAGLEEVAANFWLVLATGTAAVFADFFVVNL